MNQRLKYRIANLLSNTGMLTAIERADRDKPNLLRVLAFHRVDVPASRSDWLTPWLISTTPMRFAQQMEYLACHYCVLSAQEVIDRLTSGEEIPPQAVLITFDDGYRDFAEQAWPIMRRFNLPVTVFVATAYPGDPSRIFWWDRLYQGLRYTVQVEITIDGLGKLPLTSETERIVAFNQIKEHLRVQEHHHATGLMDQLMNRLGVTAQRCETLLNWDEIRQLATGGVTFAAHTRTHPFLSRLTPVELYNEVMGALADLKRELGPPLPIFCYPDGHPDTFNDDVMKVLKQCGIAAAFTTLHGINRIGQANPLALRRLGVSMDDALPIFRLYLTRAYARLKMEC